MTFAAIEKCNLCGSVNSGWDILFPLNNEQRLVSCRSCGLIFNDRMRTDLENVYSDSYFTADEKNAEGGYFNYLMIEKALNRNYKFAYDFILKESKALREKVRILDIGCGCGFFIKQFKEMDGFDVKGVELNGTACRTAKECGLDVENVRIEDFKDARPFDYIVFFELIEHLLDPMAFMKEIFSKAQNGTRILISTPNIGSFFFGILKRKWPAIHPASHNYYFSRKTISELAGKAGFQVVRINERQLLWRDVHQLRKRMIELFPWSRLFVNIFTPMDDRIIPFLSGGSLDIILKK